MSKDLLQSKAAAGIAWTGLGQVLRQLISLGTQIALARLLMPDAFGLIAMMQIASELAQLFADFGLGAAVIQRQEIARSVLATCFWLNVGAAIVCGIALTGAGPFLASYFGHGELAILSLIAAINLIVSGAMVIPQALLTRHLQFRQIMLAQTIGSLAGCLVAVAMALSGGGVWSLAIQPLCGSIVTLTILIKASAWLPSMTFELNSVRPMIGYSGNLLGFNLVGFAGRNMHSLVIGRALGSAALGLYNMAQTIAYMPAYQVSVVVVKVLFPTLARLQDDLRALRSVYLRAAGAIAFFTFPMMVGLYATADDMVLVLFGSKWIPLSPILQIVCWPWMIHTVGTLANTVLMSIGDTRTQFRVTMISTAATALGLFVGLRWGLIGIAFSTSLVSAFTHLATTLIALNRINLGFGRFLKALTRPLLASLIMAATVMWLHSALFDFSPILRLASCILAGFVTYVGITYVINRAFALELLAFARKARA